MKKLIIFASLAVFLFFGCATVPTQEQLASADYGDPPSNHEELIKNLFSPSLFDPYSAMYTFDKPIKGYVDAAGKAYGWVVCGTINAKNRFGGYVGAKPFYIMIRDNKIIRCLHKGMTIPDSAYLGFMFADPNMVIGLCNNAYGR